MNFYEEPEATQELIDYLTDWELQYAEKICKYIKPDAIFHHDDWGSQTPPLSHRLCLRVYSSCLQKDLRLLQISRRRTDHHHSDSYAATLVPYMIEMGVDIWQEP